MDNENMNSGLNDAAVISAFKDKTKEMFHELDVVLYYSGSVREDDLFNTLHQSNIIMGDVNLDINPISQEQHGSLSEYLSGVETYLAKK